METIDKEVYFDKYCPRCKFFKVEEWDDPCDLCLENPSNTNSHKPYFYKPSKGNENYKAPQIHEQPKPAKTKLSRTRHSRKRRVNTDNGNQQQRPL